MLVTLLSGQRISSFFQQHRSTGEQTFERRQEEVDRRKGLAPTLTCMIGRDRINSEDQGQTCKFCSDRGFCPKDGSESLACAQGNRCRYLLRLL
jgi:hypothetical protein